MNHPGRATRVKCSSCFDPICVSCMRETPVGMKCPDCARQPLRVRYGKPSRYLYAAGAGLGAAGICGAALALAGLGIFLAALAGLLIGEVIYRTSGGHPAKAIRILAAIVTVIGLSLGVRLTGVPMSALLSPRWLTTAAVASLLALVRIR